MFSYYIYETGKKAQVFNAEIINDPIVVAHNCNPSTAEAKAGELTQLPEQPVLHIKF